jgi:hypothetical protein
MVTSVKLNINYIYGKTTKFQPQVKLMVTSVIGHMYGLTFKQQKGLRPEWMFQAEVTKEIEEGERKLLIITVFVK